MSNQFFRFKQFTIHQDKSAMKVCTDACLFGAWIARKKLPAGRILDIGAGTGLLSLMLAQNAPKAGIDAVEIEASAAQQCNENFEASPWRDRLHCIHTDIKTMSPAIKYDLIISNPPFFHNDLKSEDQRRNKALHSTALTLQELLLAVDLHLRGNGHFAILLPFHRSNEFVTMATQEGYFLSEKVYVKQTPRHNYFRTMLLFNKAGLGADESEITIQDAQRMYTDEFSDLLKDYYLKM